METVKPESSSPSSSKEFSCQIQDKVEERPSSPTDCAICLEQLTDKSFTNSCLHMFCFHCLLAWSKIKPECPLCKQDFCSIIHNIRSMSDYDEYHVPPPEARLSVYVNPDITPNPIFARDPHDFFANQRSFFSYRTTIMSGAYRLPRGRPDNLLIQPYVDNLEIQADFSRVNSNPTTYSRCNRREIYTKELETLPPPSSGRYRECTPEFYRENEGQIHRLVRWLQRELSALSLIARRFSSAELLRVIMDMLPVYHINSTTFFNTVNRYLHSHTSRFIREFHRFATSPFEMEQYDRECIFVRQRTGSQLSFIVTVGRDDSEDVQIIPNATNHSFRPWIDVNDLGRTHPSTSTNDAIPPTSSQSRYSNTGLLTNGQFPPGQPSTASISQTIINISDSENDDCICIDQVRSAHETIILDDSDDEQSNVKVPASVVSAVVESPQAANRSTSHQPMISVDLTLAASSSSDQVTAVKNECELKNSSPIVITCEKDDSSHDSSILSTDVSSNDETLVKRALHRKCKRLIGKKYRMKNSKRNKVSRNRGICKSSDELILSTESSEVETDKDDLDWEKRYKRKRKLKKSRSKVVPKKRKRHHTPAVMTTHEEVIQNIANECRGNSRLRSVVRRVENLPITNNEVERNSSRSTKKISSNIDDCSCDDLNQFKNEPCTSHGIYNRHRENCKFYSITPFIQRTSYFSDSD